MLDYLLIGIFFTYLTLHSFKLWRTVETINAFSLGLRSVSTFALGSTITATWISGSGFVLDLSEFYTEGIGYFIASCGMCLTLSIVAIFIVPYMERFLGKLSIASIMGEEYGQITRVITALLGCFSVAGMVFIQFKIMGNVLHYLMPFLGNFTCLVISSVVVIIYTFIGGINSVVYTDKIQAICFTLSLVIGIVLFLTTIKYQPNTTVSDSHFYFSHLLTFSKDQWIDLLLLLAYFLIPGMSPDVVQRISMGISIRQVKKAYLYSSLFLFIILLFSCYFSYLLFQVNPTILNKEQILSSLLDLFVIDGTKGILIIGLISMCMSTADSKLNIGAVLLGNDTWKCNSLNKLEKLYLARSSTIVIGLLSLLFAFKQGGFLDIILFFGSFYIPIITIPFLAAVFGFKTTERCALIAMGISFSYVVIFKFILNPDFNIIPPAILLNAFVLFTSHYLIEKKGIFGIKSKLQSKK